MDGVVRLVRSGTTMSGDGTDTSGPPSGDQADGDAESSSDVAFSRSVKAVQEERGSRAAYRRVERGGGFAAEVDDELRDFLSGVDTAFLATASADGQPYIQHRGGPKGFIRALDDHTLAFADFVGNRQYVTTGNLRENDRVCLFLIDYERRRRIKVWGTARVTPATPELVARLVEPTYRARIEQVLVLAVHAWDQNCPQHIPQKIGAPEVARMVGELRTRIADLVGDLYHFGRSVSDLGRACRLMGEGPTTAYTLYFRTRRSRG
jgi:uncharacterized protein